MSVTMTPADRALIREAAMDSGVSASAWMVRVTREEARWAVARQIANELADEAGMTEQDLAWARSVLGLDGGADD